MGELMAHDIYISYSDADRIAADAICAELEQQGMRCWYVARDIRPGQDPLSARIEAIQSSRLLILVYTGYANSSELVLREIYTASDKKIQILPFRLVIDQPSDNLQYFLGGASWMDAVNTDMRKSIRDLAEECKKKLSSRNTRGKKTGLIIGIIATAVIVAAAIIVVIILMGKRYSPDIDQSVRTEETKEYAAFQCVIGGLDPDSFQSSLEDHLGGSLSPFKIRFYNEDGDEISGNEKISSVEISLSQKDAEKFSKEELAGYAKAMVETAFAGYSEEESIKLSNRLLDAYDSSVLAVNEVIDHYKVFCNIKEGKGGQITIEPF